ITERNRSSLLQMADAARRCDILKNSAFCVAKHTVRNQCPIVRAAGTQVDVRPAIVIEVPEVAAHSIKNLIEPGYLGHIGKLSLIVSIQSWQFSRKGQAQVAGSHLPGSIGTANRRIPANKQVQPAIVVIIPKPGYRAL